jgi:hypothetical protein
MTEERLWGTRLCLRFVRGGFETLELSRICQIGQLVQGRIQTCLHKKNLQQHQQDDMNKRTQRLKGKNRKGKVEGRKKKRN